jgi:hypothetical protein
MSRAAALVLIATVAVTACSNGTRDRNQRESAIYLAVLRAAIPPAPSSGPLPLVFVSPLAEDRPLPLVVQASLIDKLSSDARVRFVDEEREAINLDAEGQPVLEDGTLIAVSKLPLTGDDFEVPVERYRSVADGVAMRYRVREVDDDWTAERLDQRPAQLVLQK